MENKNLNDEKTLISNKNTKASILYLVASIFDKGIAFITVPIFTRMLSTADYGIVTTYSSWASILAAILGMSLNSAIRFSYQEQKGQVNYSKNLVSSIFTFTLLISSLLLSITIVVLYIAPVSVSSALIVMCFLQGLFSALITDYCYYLMMEHKYISRTLLMVVPNLIAAIFSIILIQSLTENMYMGRVIPLSLSYTVIGIIVVAVVFVKFKPRFNWKSLKWALKLSLPLVLHGVALNILSQADRTMITALRDSSETGIYSIAYSVSSLATVLTTALDGLWVPWFTKKMNQKEYEIINQVGADYINLMTYVMIGLMLVSVEGIKILTDETYWDGISVMPPLVISNYIIFVYTQYVNIEYYYEKSLFITLNTVIAAVFNIVLNFIFIPKFGYVAAAYTTLASYFVSFLLHSIYARKLNKELYPLKRFIVPIIHMVIATVIFYVFINNTIIRLSVLAIYLIIMFIKERKRIGYYFPKLSSRFKFFK